MSQNSSTRSLGRDVLLLALGATFALGGSLITGLIAQNAERQSFFREQRLSEYSTLLSVMTDLDATIQDAITANTATDGADLPAPSQSQRAIDPDTVEALNKALSRVQLVGSPGAVELATEAASYYSKYLSFVSDRLVDIGEDSRQGSPSVTDWFYDGGADFMASSAECLEIVGRNQFVRVVQTDLGLEPTAEHVSSVCSAIDWDNLYPTFVDALAAGSFPSPEG